MEKDSPEFKAWLSFFKEEWPRMSRRRAQFAPDFAELWQGQDEVIIGRLLRCHLLTEYYLTQYLEAANPGLGDVTDVRLSFSQKLQLAKGTRALLMILDGVEALNRIRNRMSHRLSTVLDKQDLSAMATLMHALNRDSEGSQLDGIDLVEDFTRAACMLMGVTTAEIKELGPEAGALGLIKWRDERIEAAKKQLGE
jgi:hypothetical protein